MKGDPPRLGPYALLARVGEGGMGVVYRAVHAETGATHALKVLPPGGDPEARLRFRREAEAMARVEGHPAVLRVHAAGEDEGRPWLAMEWAGGGSLTERLREGPLTPEEAVALVRTLAGGVAHLHARGVLHRDIKPDNVLFDEAGAPRLADLGVARLRGAASLTATGGLVGTPGYMAPEQVEGRPFDERADVYGLGALLYRALTGRPPFEGSVVAVLERASREPPPPPSSLVPGLPRWLDAVCLRALAPSPDARFASARDLAAALAGPPAPGRRPVVVGLVGGLAGALVVALGLALAVAAARGSTPGPSSSPPPRATSRAPDPSALPALAARGDARAAGDLVRRALDTDAAEAARAWLLAQAVTAPDLARAVAEAVARPPTRSGLELATDVALALGDGRLASERARAARAAGSPEAWWRARLDLADDVGRLEDARQELLRLRVPSGAPAEELLLGWTPERSQAIARHLRRLAAPRGPGEVYPALGAAGEALGRRLLAGLLALDGQLQWLPEKEAMTFGELAGLLRQTEAAAPGSLEARGVEVLRRACAWSAGARGPAERRQELEALDRLLAGDLPPAQRRGALRARYGLVDRQGAAAELARAEEALGGEEELVSRLAFEHRLRVARAHVSVGWSDGARREASARRALEVVAGAPPTHQMFFGKLAREEVAALLLLGRVPGSDVLERLDATDFKVTQALMTVADGRAAEVIGPLQGLADLQVRRADGRSTYDAACTLALAQALTGDLPDARRTLEALPKDGWLHWLPWNQPDTVGRAVDLIERGVWRPSLTQVFPPP